MTGETGMGEAQNFDGDLDPFSDISFHSLFPITLRLFVVDNAAKSACMCVYVCVCLCARVCHAYVHVSAHVWVCTSVEARV